MAQNAKYDRRIFSLHEKFMLCFLSIGLLKEQHPDIYDTIDEGWHTLTFEPDGESLAHIYVEEGWSVARLTSVTEVLEKIRDYDFRLALHLQFLLDFLQCIERILVPFGIVFDIEKQLKARRQKLNLKWSYQRNGYILK